VTAPRRPAPSPTPAEPDDPRARTIGIVLIVAAVVIGVVLLAKGFSQEDSLVATAAPENDRTTTTVVTGGGVEETTTTVVPVANPPANVTVIVANGSGATGVAAANGEKLEAGGYTNTETTNAPTTATTSVYYAEGAQADAQAVATLLGFDQSTVTAMPASPPVELAGATVLVVIGSDRA